MRQVHTYVAENTNINYPVCRDVSKFNCDLCDAAFKRKFNLNRHKESIHQGEQTFECEYCLKSFLRKDHAREH